MGEERGGLESVHGAPKSCMELNYKALRGRHCPRFSADPSRSKVRDWAAFCTHDGIARRTASMKAASINLNPGSVHGALSDLEDRAL